jgi:hypothetical protein
MDHPARHVKKLYHGIKSKGLVDTGGWSVAPIVFYIFGILFIIGFLFADETLRIRFLIGGIICLAFGYILAEMIIKMAKY